MSALFQARARISQMNQIFDVPFTLAVDTDHCELEFFIRAFLLRQGRSGEQ